MSSMKVVVSGAAGQIAYSLLPLICSGKVFGDAVKIQLRLLDIPPAQEVMEGVKMELDDCAYDLVEEIICTSDAVVAFKGANAAFLVGGFPRKAGMERKELIGKNVTIFKAQGKAIEQFADKNIKVLVVANPANTNCLIAMENAPSIPRKNWCAMTRLDHERLRSFIVQRVNDEIVKKGCKGKASPNGVRKAVIWGNHSSTQVPDTTYIEIDSHDGTKPLSNYVTDKAWLEDKLIKDVQQRGAAIIKARKLSSAMSAANAAAVHMRDWFQGSPANEYVSMSVCSDKNSYGVPEGLIYSFPCRCTGNGEYEIVSGLPTSDRIKSMMAASAKELQEEKADAMEILASQQ